MGVPVDPESVARALELVRSGETVSLGGVGGKCSRSLAYRSDQFWILEFDEGLDLDRVCTEPEARETLGRSPDAVRELFAHPAWALFSQALVDGDRAQALAALEATRGLGGSLEQHRYAFEAFLAWPERRPSAEVLPRLKELASRARATLPLAWAMQGRDDLAVTKKSIEFLTALGEILGWPRTLHLQRADCHEKLGDLQATLDDCLLEQKIDSTQALAQRIEKLRSALLVA